MLKHKFIIDRLSEAQKIKILADVRCLAGDEYAKLGAPSFKLSDIEDYGRDTYPSAKSLANSWNLKLISDVANDMALGMTVDGVNVAQILSPVAKLNINAPAISEDPYFASKVAAEYLSSVGKWGLGVVVDGAYLDADDVSRLDKKPDTRLINEFVIAPLKRTVDSKKCNGITVSSDIDEKYYETVNSDIADKITVAEQKSFQNAYILCKNIAPEDTVARIVKGHICLDASEIVLKSAIDRYKRLKADIEKGKVSVCELNAEIENGSAFPPERIDAAVDRVFEFVCECTSDYKGKLSSYTPNATLIKNACYESTVLLKNSNNILPLKSGTVAALVGDILVNYSGEDADKSASASGIAYYLRNQGCSPTGFYRGYSMFEDKSDSLLSELYASLANVETVLLFIGTNPQIEAKMTRTKNLYLPANQIAALNIIRNMGKKVVAVVCSDLTFDATFDSLVDALIVAPINTKYGAEAAIDVIMGKASPIGRLANTIYRETEFVNKKQSYYLALPSAKVGTFLGYRYYDTANFEVAYPFGFGLSYAKLQYSNLSVQGNDVVFTVKNKTKNAATEVVELYVGLKKSKRLRPKKELVGFEKITVGAGDSMTVRIPLDNLERFDAVSGEWKVEQGEYRIYVCTSVQDVKLVGKALLGNVTLEAVKESASDYLQSETNIISDKYTLEADYKLMKKNVRNIVFGVGSLCLSIAMFLFSLLSGSVGIFFIIVASILAVAGVVFFILEGCDRSKLHKSEREFINAANKESFGDAVQLEGFIASQVFNEEFDSTGSDSRKESAPVQKKADNYLEYVNADLTFKEAATQFMAFAASRGYRVDESSVKEIFAAMSASRLIITKGMTNDSFAAFVRVLSEYFGTEVGVDVVDNSYTNDNNALFKTVGTSKQKTALAKVIERSGEAKEKVHIAALSDVNFAGISNYFVPFSRYARNPRNSTVIETVNEFGDSVSFKPSENLWFFVNLRMGESLKNIPAYISELASVVKIDYSGAVPTRSNVEMAQFNYYQFDFMLDKIKANNGIPEEIWKKIDSLEEFIRSNTPYVLSNRVCIAIEKFYAVYSACGGEEKDALDRALSARVIPSAVVALNGIENTDNKNLSEKLEMIFGEDNIEASRAAIRASGTTVI